MGTVKSHIQVVNYTDKDVVNTSVDRCVNYDWVGSNRPDRNFQGYRIPAGGSVSQRATLNKQASNCPFNMSLIFSDGSVDKFRIHQKYVIGCCAEFSHSIRSHNITFHKDGNILVVKVTNTQQQLQNQKAEQKNREGEAAMRQKQHEVAMKKFDEALGLANQSSTINTVKSNKSRAYNEFGKECLQKACDLEADVAVDKSEEAQSKFDEAKDLFQKAYNLCSASKYQENINLVNLKIEGNQLFNEANDLEQEAFKLFESGKGDDAAQSKYNQALVKYEEARKKFVEGANIDREKFDESVKIAGEHIEAVNKVVDDIEQNELNHNIGKVNIADEDKKENEDEQSVSTNLIQQVDGVSH